MLQGKRESWFSEKTYCRVKDYLANWLTVQIGILSTVRYSLSRVILRAERQNRVATENSRLFFRSEVKY
jgi:hypothetical protein